MSSPSLLHQLLVELMEKQLAALLPAEIAAAARSGATGWTPTKSELGSTSPAELRADLVMRLGTEDAAEHVVIVEVQLRWDDEKRWRWPHYFAAARDRYRCDVSLVVVTPTRQVARRCASSTEFLPGTNWRPLVLGPDEALDLLQREPGGTCTNEARMLLVLLAGRRGGAEIAHHALGVIRSLDSAAHPHYLELLDRMLSPAGRTLLWSLTMNQLAQDNVWKHKNPLTRALLSEGQKEGRKKGRKEGRKMGRKAGRKEGFREALLSLAASACSETEMVELQSISDLGALRSAVHARLGLPAPPVAEE